MDFNKNNSIYNLIIILKFIALNFLLIFHKYFLLKNYLLIYVVLNRVFDDNNIKILNIINYIIYFSKK